MSRLLTYGEAVREATDQCLASDPGVYLMGLGAPDPTGVFGTTRGLHEVHGEDRVMDMPTSENGMTGVAIGSALVGMRPMMTHQRVDFALLALEQIVNQAANWHYMFGGQMSVPLVIRMVIGRGWGQGPQHSQNLHATFAHVPGLKVVLPTTAYDAKGLLIASVEDNNPVIFLEHRWLHNASGEVPEGMYRVPLGEARVMREGRDVTLVASSFMSLESLQAAEALAEEGIDAEVVDLRTVKPLDEATVLESVARTGRLIAVDGGWRTAGFAGEIVAVAVEGAMDSLRAPPKRVTLPDCPTPTTRALANSYYPRAAHIVAAVKEMLGLPVDEASLHAEALDPYDVPDPSFKGPF